MSRSRLRRLPAKLASVEFILICIGLAMMLVVFGTLAQVDIGTFNAQKKFFNSFWIYGTLFGHQVPLAPGGIVVGTLWAVSLFAALATRFTYFLKNPGLLLTHAGLILLLLGQFLTQTVAVESQLPISVGQTLDYTESVTEKELAVIDRSDPEYDDVVSIPESILARGGDIRAKPLPFVLRLRRYFPNSALSMTAGAAKPAATQGLGKRVSIEPAAPVTADDETNVVSALVEVVDAEKSLGTWLLSSALGAPQSVRAGGKDYELYIRPRRYYLPYSLTLKEFRHDKYPGTDIPKNFSSLVRLRHPQAQEDREALIYMNNPLRYEGQTFYQASFGNNDTLSVLQVVRNPAWLTPYISCLMVLVGMAVQFLASWNRYSGKGAAGR